MSWLSDSSGIISGAWVSSAYPGHGILGAYVPVTGTNGGSIIALCTTVDPAKEYRLEVVSLPSGMTLNEDGSGSGTASGVASLRIFEDGIDLGLFTVTIVIPETETPGGGGDVTPMEDAFLRAMRRAARRRTQRATAERHVNYMLKASEPTREKAGFYREQVPGLLLGINVGGGAVRGVFTAGERAFVVIGSYLYEMYEDWSMVQRGTLLTNTGRIDMAQGLLSLVVVDGPYGYILTLGTNAFGRITDVDFYGSNRVSFLDGKFIFSRPETQQFYWSSSVDQAENYDALDFASAESFPDKIVAHLVDHRELWLVGERSIEIWLPNPLGDQVYQRNSGATIEVGCASTHSLQQIDNTVVWIGRDKQGQGIVWMAGGGNGYTPQRISTNDIEDDLSAMGDLSAAYAWTYQDAGQTFYVLQVPGVDTTWVWDASTRKWHERAEYTGGDLEPWRADCHMFAFGRHVVGDGQGRLYELTPYEYTYAGSAMYREWTSPHQSGPQRRRVFFGSLRLDITAGETDSGLDPQMEMRYSNDGGYTWGAWTARSTGRIGQYGQQVKWDRNGHGRDRVWQFRTTDDAKVSIIGMAVEAQEASS